MTDDAVLAEANGDFDNAVREWQSVETLDEPVREESVEEARKILRWLRNLQSTEMNMEEWLGAGSLPEQAAKAGPMAKLVKIFLRKLRKARKKRPGILEEENSVENARMAAAAMLLAVAEFFLTRLSENDARADELESLIDALPEEAVMRQTQSVKRLIDTLSLGLDRVLGKAITLSPAEQLAEISGRVRLSAILMRPADDMEPPAREESIDLAREILRRLKNMPIGEKSLQEMVESGKAEDKTAFAQQIDEMVEIYQNLLAEAATLNPNILQDFRIKEASDAAGSFSHAISLMAAKEMPNSVAAAQKISADAAQTPEEWKDLHHHTVGRLIKSMEGGLEKAVNDLETQEQEQQQRDEEQSQEMREAALGQHSEHSRRRKRRRRRSSSRSGYGGKKQLKQMLDLTADDYVLKQGRFSRDTQTARIDVAPTPTMPGLSADALAAVRQLSGSLREMGEQIRDIGASLTSVGSSDRIVPDDKGQTQVQKQSERDNRPQGGSNRPRGTRPRN